MINFIHFVHSVALIKHVIKTIHHYDAGKVCRHIKSQNYLKIFIDHFS